MNVTALSLPVILPEFILAIGVARAHCCSARCAANARSGWSPKAPSRCSASRSSSSWSADRPEGVTFYGAFTDDAFARFMKALALIGSLTTLLLSIDFMRSHKIGGFEFPVLLLLVDARHDDADLGQRFHRALSRPRTDESRALCRRRLSPRRPARLRGGPQIFRARRALLGHAALRRIADVRLFRHGLVRRRRRGAEGHLRRSASCSASSSCWRASRSRYPRCRSTCGRPTSIEGAPTPVTTFFASGPKMAAMAVLVRVTLTAFPGIAGEWRQIVDFHRDRLDGAGLASRRSGRPTSSG